MGPGTERLLLLAGLAALLTRDVSEGVCYNLLMSRARAECDFVNPGSHPGQRDVTNFTVLDCCS